MEYDKLVTKGQGDLLAQYDHVRHRRALGVSQGLQDKDPFPPFASLLNQHPDDAK